MRAMFTAPTVAPAEAEFAPFLEFPPELRKVAYTTSVFESLIPADRGTSRVFPNRTSRDESSVASSHVPKEEQGEHDRPNQQLDTGAPRTRTT